ncbi:hypothetical protein KC19_9G188400 [Ceratodon purpureus]|uniref:Uncharacterized protein n=1 Tax=Ceratodon purpureus TaxID=3225 RepID=A0A8T0GWS3_CERPU|nr:hypothetical protein KC19_9G188400 [Ceratodon purpureus]
MREHYSRTNRSGAFCTRSAEQLPSQPPASNPLGREPHVDTSKLNLACDRRGHRRSPRDAQPSTADFAASRKNLILSAVVSRPHSHQCIIIGKSNKLCTDCLRDR